MTDPKLLQFKALCFDVYGTLVDWETGIYQNIEPLITLSGKPWTKTDALVAFHEVEKDIEAQYPAELYPEILAKTFYALAKRLDLPENDELKAASITFGNSIGDWPPFPDTIAALAQLSKHYRLVVLSNVDRKSFSFTKEALQHGFKFDLVLTAEDIGSYKPNLANFEYMLKNVKEEFGIDKHEVLVTAISLFHDHAPANALGMASSWIVREGSVLTMNAKANYVWAFGTLGEMAAAVEQEANS
ncbi:HAD-like protein [Hysterangium stoloniferum]|nr:HAD-like protein [Hysterangium stoloniferum]